MIELNEAEPSVLAQIGLLGEPKMFTLSEAKALLPLVRSITKTAFEELSPIGTQLDAMLVCDPRRGQLTGAYETKVRRWISKLERLGVTSSGLWRVDFDTGDGYLSWRFPELRIAYFRKYQTDFQGRQSLAEVIENTAPEWA